LAAQEIQIGQSHQPIQLGSVVLQASVTGLAKAELAFDDSENMFDAGSDRRVFAVAVVLTLATRQVFAGLAFVVDAPAQA